MKLPTQTSHPPVTTPAANNRPLVSPIYQSVKFAYSDVAATREGLAHDGYFYSRSSNPTTRQLELSLARLQGRDDAVVCASGVGAIAQTLFSLLQQGDHVLCFGELYGPTRTLVRRTLARYGVTHTMLSIYDDADIEQVLATTPTRLVVFESPTNPVTRIADIARITAAARRHGALTLLDNTLAGPHQHGSYDIDYFLHSLTKYVSGHGDVMGGAVIILFFLPWLDKSAVKSIRYRPDWHIYVYAVFVVNFVVLAYLGVQPPSAVGERISQVGTLYYFGFFLLMPWWSSMGDTKPVPSRVNFAPY